MHAKNSKFGSLEIAGYELVNDTLNLTAPASSGRMTLKVNIDRNRYNGVALKPIEIPLFVETTGFQITGCSTDGSHGGAGQSCSVTTKYYSSTQTKTYKDGESFKTGGNSYRNCSGPIYQNVCVDGKIYTIETGWEDTCSANNP